MRPTTWMSHLMLGAIIAGAVGCGSDGSAPQGSDSGGVSVPTGRVTAVRSASPTGGPAGTATPCNGSPTQRPTRTPILEPIDPDGALRIGSAHGAPGAVVAIDVTLVDAPEPEILSALQNDIVYGDEQLVVLVRTDGKPDCSVNPALGKERTDFAFVPGSCGVDTECTGMRALVLSFHQLDMPIPAGAVVYSCNVLISSDAQPGSTHALRCADALGSDPEGNQIVLQCEDGAIDVSGQNAG